MTTHFFRLLKTPIDDKSARLAAQIAALNETGQDEETYALDPADFSLISGSPFAYWVQALIRELFVLLPKVADGKLAYSQEIVERYFHLSDLTLTPRELDVLYLAGEGMSNCEIADRLSISPVTIRNHLEISYLLGSERVPQWRARPYYVRSRARFETS